MPHVDPNKVLYAYKAEPGIIKWRELKREEVNEPVPIPPVLPTIIYPDRTLERMRKHFGDYYREIEELTKEIEEGLEKVPELERELTKWLERNPKVLEFLKKELQIAAVTGGIVIIAATIAEDIVTGGAGVADDAVSFAFASKLFQIAAKL